MTTPEIVEFANRDALMHAVADRLAEALRDAIERRGEACAALSGGSTPEPAYRLLAAMPLKWDAIALALVDERFVEPSHPASNEGLIRRTLASALDAGAVIKPMYLNAPGVGDAAQIADAEYAVLEIDIALLGMGADGHTASWFRDSVQFEQAIDLANPRRVIAVRAPSAEACPDRLTLTRSALARVGSLLLATAGVEKRARLEAALAGDPAPVSALFDGLPRPPQVYWAP